MPDGYTLSPDGNQQVSVKIGDDGAASPEAVVFEFVKEAEPTDTPTPEPPTEPPVTAAPVTDAPVTDAPVTDAPVTETPTDTPAPVLTPVNLYAQTNAGGVNFRSEPSVDSKKAFSSVDSGTYVWVYGTLDVTESDGTVRSWASIRYSDTDCYVWASLLDILSQEDSDAYNYAQPTPIPGTETTPPPATDTPAPTDTPTEAPTDTPTGAPAETLTEAPTETPTEAPTEPPTATPADTAAPSSLSTVGRYGKTNTNSVNFRSEPAPTAKSVLRHQHRHLRVGVRHAGRDRKRRHRAHLGVDPLQRYRLLRMGQPGGHPLPGGQRRLQLRTAQPRARTETTPPPATDTPAPSVSDHGGAHRYAHAGSDRHPHRGADRHALPRR